MIWIPRLRLRRSRDQAESPVASLDAFMQLAHNGRNLDSDTARQNLIGGVIGIIGHKEVDNGRYTYSSNGLLITNDGYFLTARHGLEDLDGIKVRLANGQTCRLKRVCALGRKEDVALAKADLPKDPTPREYRFSDVDHFSIGMPVALITRKDGIMYTSYGLVNKVNNPDRTQLANGDLAHYFNQFVVCIRATPGDSGSIVTSAAGELLGLISSSSEHYGSIVRISKALELVDFYRRIVARERCS